MDSQTVERRAQHPPRLEDGPLLRGLGRYAADAPMAGQAQAYFVRSPHAFADIRSIDTTAAKAVPGVLCVLTAADMEGIGNLSQHPPLAGRGGQKLIVPHRPALAGKTVRHVGEALAVVVAETLIAAQDAAELVAVDYQERAPAVDLREAIRDGAPQLWSEAPGNIAVDWPGLTADPDANASEVDRIIASAAHVARVGVVHQRIMVQSMEPRGATASYEGADDSYYLRCCSQSARALRDGLAPILGVPNQRLRVVTQDVGGAFGLKTGPYPEYLAILVAARKIGRPVHWMSNRAEAFLSDNHARDAFSDVELALDERGKFLALRVRHLANMGAYIGAIGANIQTVNLTRCFPGMYDIPRIDMGVRCVFTNTTPTAPYRGAGRPEANFILERVVDEAARVTGIDPVKLRRRNLIKPSAMPYKTAVGTTIDSGEFATVLDKALALADYDGFKQRRRAAAKGGKYRGLGIACMLEHAGGAPLEGTALSFPGGETLVLGLNVQSTGQGHASAFNPLLAERLGIKVEQIEHRHGDSAMEVAGYASVGSRSAMTVSHALIKTAEAMLAKGKTIAATVLEAADTDIEYRDGRFSVVGTDRAISLFELAARAKEMKKRGEIAEDLDTKTNAETPLTFPNGCHIAEVEIDPATGALALAAYSAVDDCGKALSAMIVEGQTHGAIAQGVGQAMMEAAVFDASGGQLITGSFMDYAMPRADDLPVFKDAIHAVPAKTNPLGVKGAGEAGTTAAISALMNAVADAIPGGAGAHLDMPATAEKIWRACRQAQRK
ncbi:MAG: xanthine dehydrogenase family protein molybdopterin-binding subunit [Hyphomicrobiales bacterium]|nr:xanthine dehydrogenase family protein molybdopterin-binding subunit [Hyphomicrobiales bacterium]